MSEYFLISQFYFDNLCPVNTFSVVDPRKHAQHSQYPAPGLWWPVLNDFTPLLTFAIGNKKIIGPESANNQGSIRRTPAKIGVAVLTEHRACKSRSAWCASHSKCPLTLHTNIDICVHAVVLTVYLFTGWCLILSLRLFLFPFGCRYMWLLMTGHLMRHPTVTLPFSISESIAPPSLNWLRKCSRAQSLGNLRVMGPSHLYHIERSWLEVKQTRWPVTQDFLLLLLAVVLL